MSSKGFWFGLISVVAFTLGFSDTAMGQLTSNPPSWAFNVSPGSTQTQLFTVTGTTATTITAVPNVSWLGISPSGPVALNNGNNFSVVYTVTASAQGFATGTMLQGSFQVGGAGPQPLIVGVTMNVGGSSSGTLVSNPVNLNYTATVGGTLPAAQPVTISNNVAGAATFSVSTTPANSWLLVSASQGTTGTASATFNVSVNQNIGPLAAGTYDGQVVINSTAGSFPIPVRLTVTGAATLTASPSGPLNFFFQTGGANPAPQNLTLTASTGTIAYIVSSTASSPGTWLVLSQQGSGATVNGTASIGVSVSTSNLLAGTYTGSITIAPQNTGQNPIQIAVNLLVSNNPLLQLSNSSVTFNGAAGTTSAFTQQVTVTSSGTALNFNAVANSGSAQTNWLSVAPTSGTTGTQSGTLTVRADPTNLAAGVYNGTVTLSSQGAANSPTIQVTMTLSNSLLINAAPPSLTFNFQTNQTPPAAQTVSLTSNGASQAFSVAAATTNCGNWLTASAQGIQTPASVIVSVSTAQGGFTPGTPCQGTVTITPGGQGVNPIVIPVTLNVSNTALLTVSPMYIAQTVQAGQDTLPPQGISISSTDPVNPISFGATVTPGAPWLLIGSGGFTPLSLQYQISPKFLTPGTYTGTINITPNTAGVLPSTVTIALTVQSSTGIASSSPSLTFTQAQGAGAPPTQTLHLTSNGGGGIINYSFSALVTTPAGGNWLSVLSPTGQSTGSTPGDIIVTANGANLVQGSYDGVITVVAPGANNTPLQIPVRLNVTTPQILTLSTNTLGFNYQIGATSPPADQTVTITTTGGPATFTVTKTVQQPAGGTWLSVSPASGTTANSNGQFIAPVTVSVNPTGLAAGTYTGTVSIASPIAGQPSNVTVTLTVVGVPAPAISVVLNAASLQPGPISPGEIMTVKGTNLGPTTPVNYTLNAQGGLNPSLGGVRVLFDGIPGSPYYVSATQINVIAPYEIGGRISTTVTVEYSGQTSSPIGQTYSVQAATPGIFTLNSSGSGPGAIVNQDGTINGPGPSVITAFPTFGAPRGSSVAIFATGYGTNAIPGTTGCFNPLAERRSALPVTASIITLGGITIPLEVQYAGGAPGGPCGFMQINVKVPDAAPLGRNFVTFTVNTGASPLPTSPANVEITVR